YGYGDIFLGITVPVTRSIAKKYQHIPLEEAEKLLQSVEHECRVCALEICIFKFQKKKSEDREAIFELYIKNMRQINNWDLVDLSAPKIIGKYLENRDRSLLYKLVKSENLWERRISVITTLAFVRNNDLKDALSLCEILLQDPEDLMRKAVGWVLREIGKKDEQTLKEFLKAHIGRLSRTSLRYAIERLSPEERSYFMQLK
ncbi:MAG: DNA alkylation repair protein, partial [Bacteroidales bacterium]